MGAVRIGEVVVVNSLFVMACVLVAVDAALFYWGKTWMSCFVAVLWSVVVIVASLFLMVMCFGRHAGPPDWDMRCATNLKRLHVEKALRDKVIGREPLSQAEVERLLATKDNATYCLLALNGSLEDDDLEQMYEQGDGEVRHVLATQLPRADLRAGFKTRYDTACRWKACGYALGAFIAIGSLAVLFLNYAERIENRNLRQRRVGGDAAG